LLAILLASKKWLLQSYSPLERQPKLKPSDAKIINKDSHQKNAPQSCGAELQVL
jgi:hypothetical protein